jgi:hypothetical protein
MSSKIDLGIAKFAMLTIVAGLVIGTASMTSPVAAENDNAHDGLERADDNVHENTDSGTTPETLSDQDVKFHQGLCQGGHETDAVGEIFKGGCDDIPPPGNSGDNREDE